MTERLHAGQRANRGFGTPQDQVDEVIGYGSSHSKLLPYQPSGSLGDGESFSIVAKRADATNGFVR